MNSVKKKKQVRCLKNFFLQNLKNFTSKISKNGWFLPKCRLLRQGSMIFYLFLFSQSPKNLLQNIRRRFFKFIILFFYFIYFKILIDVPIWNFKIKKKRKISKKNKRKIKSKNTEIKFLNKIFKEKNQIINYIILKIFIT